MSGYVGPVKWMGRRSRRFAVAAVAAVAALLLAGCSGGPTVIAKSSVAVGFDVAYSGVGPDSPAATAVDRAVGAAALSGFSYVDASGKSVADPSFGTIAVVSSDPLVVRYTVDDGLRWSDGAGIDAVDLLLDWAARSGGFAASGFAVEPDPALESASGAQLSGDRKSLTVSFGDPTADYAAAFRDPLPAHVAAERAFSTTDVAQAEDDVVAAVDAGIEGAPRDLGELAAAWTAMFGPDGAAPPSSGPYVIDTIGPDAVELVANGRYSGDRRPTYAALELRTITHPLAAIQALDIGRVQLIEIAWSKSAASALLTVGADSAAFPAGKTPTVLEGWFHRLVDGAAPRPTGAGIAWNPWEWVPADSNSG